MFFLIFAILGAAGVIGLILLGDFIVCCCSNNVNENESYRKRNKYFNDDKENISDSVPYDISSFPVVTLGEMTNNEDNYNILMDENNHAVQSDTNHCDDVHNKHSEIHSHHYNSGEHQINNDNDVFIINDNHRDYGGHHNSYNHDDNVATYHSTGGDYGAGNYDSSGCYDQGGVGCDSGGGSFD